LNPWISLGNLFRVEGFFVVSNLMAHAFSIDRSHAMEDRREIEKFIYTDQPVSKALFSMFAYIVWACALASIAGGPLVWLER